MNNLTKGELSSHSINDNLTKEGKIITCEWNNSLIHDDDGNIIGAISLGLDITERKTAEEERERLIHELKDALAKVKTLSGLIPICSSCQKIRDDKGYWKLVADYISEHSEAEFTHGYCPECLENYKKTYPDYFKKKDN